MFALTNQPKKLNQRSLSRDELGLQGVIAKKKKKRINVSDVDIVSPRGMASNKKTLRMSGSNKNMSTQKIRTQKTPKNLTDQQLHYYQTMEGSTPNPTQSDGVQSEP